MRQTALANNLANANTPGYQRGRRRLPRRAPGGARPASAERGRGARLPARRPTARSARCAPTATTSTSTPSRPSSPRTASSTRPLVQVAARAHRHPPDRDRGDADGHLRRARHLRLGADRRAAAHGRHRREPRQRPDHPRRRRPALPPQGGRPPGGRAGGGFAGDARRRDGRRRRRSPGRRRGRRHRRGPDAAQAWSTTRATPTPTRKATSRCRTSTRSPRWST